MTRPLAAVAVASLALAASACAGGADAGSATRSAAAQPDSRLEARPGGRGGRCSPGLHTLAAGPERKALLHVTPPAQTRRRALLLALHGAGSGGARGGLWIFRAAWDVPGLVIVAPGAAGTSWSPADIPFVDRALGRAFARCAVDPDRVAVGGFSAGGSLALWLGLANGDLFGDVIALSPGAVLPSERVGRPRVFLAHGLRDVVIPARLGGDAAARALRSEGYRVRYTRFPGGHRVLPGLAAREVRRIVAR